MFPKGTERLKDRRNGSRLAPEMATDQNPYFVLIESDGRGAGTYCPDGNRSSLASAGYRFQMS